MVTLRLLGGIDLKGSSGEEFLPLLPQPKRMAVLSYLAVAGQGKYLRRDGLMAVFWPESDLTHARNALNQSLHALRNALEDGVVRTRGKHEVGLDPERLQCDVWSFREAVREGRYQEALDLYAGPLLPSFHVTGGGEFERWLEEERGSLREAAAGAAWALAHTHIRRGFPVEAERTAQVALGLVWTDETPVRDFIKALADAGDRASALNFYERFRARLSDELDLDPSRATEEIAEQIRNGSPIQPLRSSADEREDRGGASVPGEDVSKSGNALETGPASPRASVGGTVPWSHGRGLRWAGSLALLATATSLAILRVRPEKAWVPNPRDVAVAPFINRTGDPTRDELGLLIAENIRVRLDQAEIGKLFPQPRVISALEKAGSGADPFTVLTRDLGAGVVVTGEYFQRGDTLVVSAYCLDAQDGGDLGPVTPARGDVGDARAVITQIQDRVSGVLVQHLEGTSVGRRVIRPPLSAEAFRAYQRAWDAQGGEEADVRSAVPLFYRAFELDSTYMAPLIRAWFLLMWWQERGQGGYASERDSLYAILDRSRPLMSTAQSLWVDWARAEFQGPRNPQLALRAARRLKGISAADFAYELGFSAARLNYLDEALNAFREYEKPNGEFLEALADYNYFFDYAQVLHRLGRHEKELEILFAGQRRNPDMRPLRHLELRARVALGDLAGADSVAKEVPRYSDWMYMVHPAQLEFYGHGERARAFLEGEVQRFEMDSVYRADPRARAGVLSALGRQEEALAILEPLMEQIPGDQGIVRMVGIAAARMGDTARAHEMDRRLAEIPNVQREPWARAFLAGALGERNRALAFMKQISPTQGGWFMFRHGKDFRSLQGYPPFEEFMRPKR